MCESFLQDRGWIYVGAGLRRDRAALKDRGVNPLLQKTPRFVLRNFLVLACLFWAGPAHAQDRPLVQVAPSRVGMAETALENVTRYLQQEVDSGQLAGAVGLVARHGKIAYFEAVGDCQKDSIFRLASMTKTVTAVAVMKLVEEGAIQLDDPVSNYLPEFQNPQVAVNEGKSLKKAKRLITIHDLLTHTSGIGYSWFGPAMQDKAYREADVADIMVPIKETIGNRIKRLGPLPLAFEPGEGWSYGLSFDVLGRLVEVVSGLTLEQYFHERIFRPLQMNETEFFLPKAKRNRLVEFYTVDADKKLQPVPDGKVLSAGPINYSADYCYEGNGSALLGGSGLVGTTADYVRLLQMLLNGGSLEGVSILQRQSVESMTRNQTGSFPMPFPGHGDGYGYGFAVLTEKGKSQDVASVGTYSWGGLYNTYFWVDPQEELIGLVMTQIFPYDHLTLREDFKKLVYQAIDDSGFSRRYWYGKGLEHGNPFFNNKQLRVNSPNVSVHPNYASRSEPRSSGLARILVEEDLRTIAGARLYCEVWGGHPGTFNKRISINGRSSFSIPDTGTADDNCTHSYPSFNLAPSDLVNGYNSLQFACDRADTAWGHYIVNNAALDIRLPSNHSDIVSSGLDGFAATISSSTHSTDSIIHLKLNTNREDFISQVVFQGRYYGYDENGNGWESDWHGMTKEREPYGMLGVVEKPPFALNWDTGMLPAQSSVEVRAFIHFKADERLIYQTADLGGLKVVDKKGSKVALLKSNDLPKPFWSRAGRLKECTLQIDFDPASIEAAELHIVSWTGGAGKVEKYFTLNGHFFPVAEGSSHEEVYSVLPIDASILKQGENRFKLLSDTESHGIEIHLPGPALMVRRKVD